MAKLEQGILGPFRGTVGSVIGYRWRDRWCIRARPRFYHDRRSEAQLMQRSRFKAMIMFASPATPLLRLGLRAWADRHALTEGNAFLRLNHPHFQNNRTDYPCLRFSHGSLPAIGAPEASRLDALTISVRWERGLGRGADMVHLYAYCPAAGTGLAVAAMERGRRQAQFLLPQDFAGEEVHLWAFAVGEAGVASPSLYVPFADEEEMLAELTDSSETTVPDAPRETTSQSPMPMPQLVLAFGSPPD